MARRRRRDTLEDDDEEDEKESSREKYRQEEDERKIKRSRRKRRESYDRSQDLKMFIALIIIISGILLGYFYYINYMPEDEIDTDDFNTYTPPVNPDNNNNGGGSNNGGGNGGTTIYDIPSGITASEPGNTLAVIEIQDYGAMVIELYDSKMPITVANFIDYLNIDFYDGLLIHRISQNPDIIQGGGKLQDGNYKNTNDPIQLETHPDLTHEVGTIAMARTSDPNSATSQWYINCGENHYLDDQYAVFGKVIYGDAVYQAVNNVPVNGEEPVNPVIIKSAYVYTPTL